MTERRRGGAYHWNIEIRKRARIAKYKPRDSDRRTGAKKPPPPPVDEDVIALSALRDLAGDSLNGPAPNTRRSHARLVGV